MFILQEKKDFNGLKRFLYKNCSVTNICLSMVTVLMTIVLFSSNSHRSRNKDYLFGQWCLEPLQKRVTEDLTLALHSLKIKKSTITFNDSFEKGSWCRTFLLLRLPLHSIALFWLNNSQESSPGSQTVSIFRTRTFIFGSTVICLPKLDKCSPHLCLSLWPKKATPTSINTNFQISISNLPPRIVLYLH